MSQLDLHLNETILWPFQKLQALQSHNMMKSNLGSLRDEEPEERLRQAQELSALKEKMEIQVSQGPMLSSWTRQEMCCLPAEFLLFTLVLGRFVFQSLSRVWLFVTPWTVACQASLSFISRSSLKLMSIELVMPSNHLILCCPLLLLSQHEGLVQWVSSSHQVARVLELLLQHQSFRWLFRIDFF